MDAMSGRGELGDRGLVADFYGLGGRAEYRTGRIEADGADSQVNGADWRTGRTGQTPSYWTGQIGRNTGLGGLGQTGQTSGLAD